MMKSQNDWMMPTSFILLLAVIIVAMSTTTTSAQTNSTNTTTLAPTSTTVDPNTTAPDDDGNTTTTTFLITETTVNSNTTAPTTTTSTTEVATTTTATTTTTEVPTPDGEIKPVTVYTRPIKTNVSAEPPFHIEDLEGNIFYPMGYDSEEHSCNTSTIRNTLQSCVDQFHSCYGNQRRDLKFALCPLTIGSCIVQYSECLLQHGGPLISNTNNNNNNNANTCSWAPAFFSAGIEAASSSSGSSADLYDCAVFVRTFAFKYYKCFPMVQAICSDVVSLFAQRSKEKAPEEIKKTNLKQTPATKFPRGMLPIVIAKSENDNQCTRPYFTSSTACRCPSEFNRMRLFEPSYLFAAANETTKLAASNFDHCFDRSVSVLENVSFAVRNVVSSSSSSSLVQQEESSSNNNNNINNRRANEASGVTCDLEGQTLRELKVLAESESTLSATGRMLASCAPRDTNIFIINSISGACYSPRENVSCSCGDATSIGLPIVFLNDTTNVADSGILIICNFPLPPKISSEQAATLGVVLGAGLMGGPAAQNLQGAAVVTMLDCTNEDSEAQQQGRYALVPFQIGDSEAGGIYFLLAIIIGIFFAYGLVVTVLAVFRYNSSCTNYCSGHDKAPTKYTAKNSEPIDHSYEILNDKDHYQFADAVHDNENGEYNEMKEVIDEDQALNEPIRDEDGNIWTRKKSERTVLDEKMTTTYLNEQTKEVRTKKFRKKYQFGHLNDKNLGFFYHFKTSCASLRFPGFFCFVILRIFFQGLAFESIYLASREEPGTVSHSLGIVGCLLTASILLGYIIVGRALKYKNYSTYIQHRKLYKNWPEVYQNWVGADGMWENSPNSYRHGLAWDDFSGRGDYVHVIVPINFWKAVILAALTAPPWSVAACEYIYYVLIAIFVVFGVLLIFLRPVYRFPIATFTDAHISLLTAAMLLFLVLNWPGQNDIYLAIVYSSLVLAILTQILAIHEFVVGFCVDIDEDEEKNNPDEWETDSDNDDDENSFSNFLSRKVRKLMFLMSRKKSVVEEENIIEEVPRRQEEPVTREPDYDYTDPATFGLQEDYYHDEDTTMFWSDRSQMYFNPETKLFGNPIDGAWYYSEKISWVNRVQEEDMDVMEKAKREEEVRYEEENNSSSNQQKQYFYKPSAEEAHAHESTWEESKEANYSRSNNEQQQYEQEQQQQEQYVADDWSFDENSGLYWSGSLYLFKDPHTQHLYSPETSLWYNPYDKVWYQGKES